MFKTHKLNESGFEDVKRFKSNMKFAVESAMELMPEGREKSVFKTQIETALFYGTKSIAGKEGNFTEIIEYN